MDAYKEAASILVHVNNTLTTDPDTTNKAFALLLLGKEFKNKLDKQKVRDPTDYILDNPSLTVPNI